MHEDAAKLISGWDGTSPPSLDHCSPVNHNSQEPPQPHSSGTPHGMSTDQPGEGVTDLADSISNDDDEDYDLERDDSLGNKDAELLLEDREAEDVYISSESGSEDTLESKSKSDLDK